METLLHVNTNSKHLPNISEQLPTMMNIHLPSLSINKDDFNKAQPLFEKTLKRSGFNNNLKFESIQTKRSRKRKKNAVWLIPPYNAEVKTNIGKVFWKVVRKLFRKRHGYKKILKTNTIKLSDSFTTNVVNLIQQHYYEVWHFQLQKQG